MTEVVAYITKYALTKGIQRRLVEERHSGACSYLVRGYSHWLSANEWHRTFEAAQAHARKMCIAKIVSHEKSIAKLDKMKFEEPADFSK